MIEGTLTTRNDGADEEKRDGDSVLGKYVHPPGEEELGDSSDDRLMDTYIRG